MHLTNFHFYSSKNYLFSKPVKGLCVCLVGYRFGFNGKERDNETYGEGNAYDFGARIYDSRLGRFLSVDPCYHISIKYSPYQFAGNSPIEYIDYEGKFKINSKSNILNSYLKNGVLDLLKDENLKTKMMELGHFKTEQDLRNALSDGNGPNVEIQSHGVMAAAYYNHETDVIYLDPDFISQLESASEKTKQAALLAVVGVLLHETIHYGRDQMLDPTNTKWKNKETASEVKTYIEMLGDMDANAIKYNKAYGGLSEVGRIFELSVYPRMFLNSSTEVSPKDCLKNAKEMIKCSGKDSKIIPQVPLTYRRSSKPISK